MGFSSYGRITGAKRPATAHRIRRAGATVELMEPRRLLAATLVGNQLVVTGTPFNDDYSVVYNSLLAKYTVTNNGVTEGAFPISQVGSIVIDAGDGDDVVYTFNIPPVTIYGGDGNDTITGPGYTNANQTAVVFGGDGHDLITTYRGADYVEGGAGNDTIHTGGGRDSVFGGDGDDVINADVDNDYVSGGAGNDLLDGGSNNDTITGDDGDDIVYWGMGSDIVSGGAGFDTYDHSMSQSNFHAKISLDGLANDTWSGNIDKDNIAADFEVVYGSPGNDTISGTANADILFGGAGNDSITGLDGDDYLDGEAGNDTIRGGNGNDTIVGGIGSDSLFGDAGDDTFYTNDLLWIDWIDGGAGNDTVYGDLLDLLFNL